MCRFPCPIFLVSLVALGIKISPLNSPVCATVGRIADIEKAWATDFTGIFRAVAPIPEDAFTDRREAFGIQALGAAWSKTKDPFLGFGLKKQMPSDWDRSNLRRVGDGADTAEERIAALIGEEFGSLRTDAPRQGGVVEEEIGFEIRREIFIADL